MIYAWAVKNAFYIAIGTIAAIALGFIVYRSFIAPVNAKHDIAAAHGQQVINQAGTDSAKEAVQAIAAHDKQEQHTDTVTRTNYVYITKQPGASDPVNPALFDAFTRSVCLRDSAAGLPECQRLQQPNP